MRLDDPSCGRYGILRRVRSIKGVRVARRIQKKEPSYDASPAEAEYSIETSWMDLRCFSRTVCPWRPVKYLDGTVDPMSCLFHFASTFTVCCQKL